MLSLCRERLPALASLVAAVASCAGTAPAVSRDEPFVPGKGDAIVVGRVSFNSAIGEAASYALSFKSVGDGEQLRVELGRQDDLGGVWGAPFFVRMPPGRYLVGAWAVELLAGYAWKGEQAPLAIDVRPGEVVCIGQIFLQSGSGTNVCPALLTAFKGQAPPSIGVMTVRLAQPAPNGR